MNQTPEPWEATGGNIDEDGRRFISIVDRLNRVIVQTVSIPQGDQRLGSPYTREANDANAARIVRCINGCAGLDPAAYRQMVEAAQELITAWHRSAVASPVHPHLDRLEQALAHATGAQS